MPLSMVPLTLGSYSPRSPHEICHYAPRRHAVSSAWLQAPMTVWFPIASYRYAGNTVLSLTLQGATEALKADPSFG